MIQFCLDLFDIMAPKDQLGSLAGLAVCVCDEANTAVQADAVRNHSGDEMRTSRFRWRSGSFVVVDFYFLMSA